MLKAKWKKTREATVQKNECWTAKCGPFSLFVDPLACEAWMICTDEGAPTWDYQPTERVDHQELMRLAEQELSRRLAAASETLSGEMLEAGRTVETIAGPLRVVADPAVRRGTIQVRGVSASEHGNDLSASTQKYFEHWTRVEELAAQMRVAVNSRNQAVGITLAAGAGAGFSEDELQAARHLAKARHDAQRITQVCRYCGGDCTSADRRCYFCE